MFSQRILNLKNKIMSLLENRIEKYIEKGSRFIGIYEKNHVTELNGETPIDAIKDFYNHYNSVLLMLFDTKEDEIYIGKENDKPDCRGYYNYSYYNKKTNELIYNEDERTPPIVIIKPSKITKDSHHGYINREGKFFECGFEQHIYFAKELFLSKTIELPVGTNKYKQKDSVIDDMGWVKISSCRVHFISQKITSAQKKTIIQWMEIIGYEKYEFMYDMMSKFEIEIDLKENY